ncbi:MAG: glycosyltransferase [Arthrospira platensis PCC 7345]|nr:glycosyltransferase [Arthrospira platensis PCC 7345]
MSQSFMFDVVIPARNEADCIKSIIDFFQSIPNVEKIIVVNNSSTDETEAIALNAKATVINEDKIGKGSAVKTGLRFSKNNYVFVCDADVKGLTLKIVQKLISDIADRKTNFCRAAIKRSPELAPVTEMVVKPLFNVLMPELSYIQEPLGGIFVCDRKFLLDLVLPDGWGFDIYLTMEIHRQTGHVYEKNFEGVTHRGKTLKQYIDMSQKVIESIFDWRNKYI